MCSKQRLSSFFIYIYIYIHKIYIYIYIYMQFCFFVWQICYEARFWKCNEGKQLDTIITNIITIMIVVVHSSRYDELWLLLSSLCIMINHILLFLACFNWNCPWQYVFCIEVIILSILRIVYYVRAKATIEILLTLLTVFSSFRE